MIRTNRERCLEMIEEALLNHQLTEEEAARFHEEVKAKTAQIEKIRHDFKKKNINPGLLNQWEAIIDGDFVMIQKRIDAAIANKHQRYGKKYRKDIYRKCAVVGAVFILVMSVAIGMKYTREHRTIANIPEPRQVMLTNNVSNTDDDGYARYDLEKTIKGDGYEVKMNFLATYEIDGLVVAMSDYDNKDASAFDKAFPRDLSLAWGKAAEISDKIEWSHPARALKLKYNTDTLRKNNVTRGELLSSVSNNHILPGEGDLRKIIKRVRLGDYIRMKGYLVRAEIFDTNGVTVRVISSSLTRTDHIEHAFDMRTSCEVLYLTDLQWLD